MAYSTMKGVMIPEVSAGSNQVGARETCTAHVAWPSGGGRCGRREGKSATASDSAIRVERAGVMGTIS